MANSILVLGGPDAGKTHYTGQLYGRLKQPNSAIKLMSTPESLTAIEQVLDRLGEGRAADHTPHATDHRMPWDLLMPSGVRANILWPDYGGEQLRDIFEKRLVPTAWVERVRDSAYWLLFIRPLRMRQYEDLVTRQRELAAVSEERLAPKDGLRPWADAAHYIELIQILLWACHAEVPVRRRSPRLMILLSCWDELVEPQLPPVVLRTTLPLLSEFISSNWDRDAWQVFGLSSLGKSLSKTDPDQEFQDLGPEAQGYVVMPDGYHSLDLTLPLVWLLEHHL